MSVNHGLPRAVGVLALLAAVRVLPPTLGSGVTAALPWALLLAAWLTAAVALCRVQQVRLAGGVLAASAAVSIPWLSPQDSPDLALLAWVALLLAVTEGRPGERALLLRVCVTAVYVFTAAAKLNPQFVDGTQLRWLIRSRAHLNGMEGLAPELLVFVAAIAVALEAWLALGLWFERTQRVTAFLGAIFHFVLIAVAAVPNVFSMTLLLVLNGLLVCCYSAFFGSQRATDHESFDQRGAPR